MIVLRVEEDPLIRPLPRALEPGCAERLVLKLPVHVVRLKVLATVELEKFPWRSEARIGDPFRDPWRHSQCRRTGGSSALLDWLASPSSTGPGRPSTSASSSKSAAASPCMSFASSPGVSRPFLRKMWPSVSAETISVPLRLSRLFHLFSIVPASSANFGSETDQLCKLVEALAVRGVVAGCHDLEPRLVVAEVLDLELRKHLGETLTMSARRPFR